MSGQRVWRFGSSVALPPPCCSRAPVANPRETLGGGETLTQTFRYGPFTLGPGAR